MLLSRSAKVLYVAQFLEELFQHSIVAALCCLLRDRLTGKSTTFKSFFSRNHELFLESYYYLLIQ